MLARSVREAIEAPLLFYPQPQLRGTPAHLGMRYEDVWLTASDGVKVHAWFIQGGSAGSVDRVASGGYPNEANSVGSMRLRVVMFHGNGGNISVRLDQYQTMLRRWGNVDLLAVEYRGYGLSEGSPSESGFAKDAEVAWDWIMERNAQDGGDYVTVLFGRSMGGAVASLLASKVRVDALILECAPSSIPYLAEHYEPWRSLHLGGMIVNRFDTESYVRDVGAPLLVMHSEHDEIVPLSCSGRIMSAANEPKRFLLLPNAMHNGADLYAPSVYYSSIEGFLREFTAWR